MTTGSFLIDVAAGKLRGAALSGDGVPFAGIRHDHRTACRRRDQRGGRADMSEGPV